MRNRRLTFSISLAHPLTLLFEFILLKSSIKQGLLLENISNSTMLIGIVAFAYFTLFLIVAHNLISLGKNVSKEDDETLEESTKIFVKHTEQCLLSIFILSIALLIVTGIYYFKYNLSIWLFTFIFVAFSFICHGLINYQGKVLIREEIKKRNETKQSENKDEQRGGTEADNRAEVLPTETDGVES